jgi:hypothetical protein
MGAPPVPPPVEPPKTPPPAKPPRGASGLGAHGERGAGLEGADFCASDWPPDDASEPVAPFVVAAAEPTLRGSRALNASSLVVAGLLQSLPLVPGKSVDWNWLTDPSAGR